MGLWTTSLQEGLLLGTGEPALAATRARTHGWSKPKKDVAGVGGIGGAVCGRCALARRTISWTASSACSAAKTRRTVPAASVAVTTAIVVLSVPPRASTRRTSAGSTHQRHGTISHVYVSCSPGVRASNAGNTRCAHHPDQLCRHSQSARGVVGLISSSGVGDVVVVGGGGVVVVVVGDGGGDDDDKDRSQGEVAAAAAAEPEDGEESL